MTLPRERSLTVKYTRDFLYDLLDSKKTPRVPKEIRDRARRLLRHFPSDFDIERAGEKCPEVFDKSNILREEKWN